MNKKGVTLIELLLYISISAVVLFSAFTFMSLMLQSKTKAVAILEVESQGMNIMQSINRVIRDSDKVTSPEPKDSTTELILEKGGQEYDYRLKDNRLYLSVNGGEFKVIHSDQIEIPKIIFRNLSYSKKPMIVQVFLVVKYKNPENRQEREYERSFYGSATLKRIP